mgnify:CR=1 FL=1
MEKIENNKIPTKKKLRVAFYIETSAKLLKNKLEKWRKKSKIW